MQSAPLLFVLQLQNLPVDPGQLLDEAPEFLITPAHLQRLHNEVLSDIERDGFAPYLGGQVKPGHGRGLGDGADEERIEMSGDFLAEQSLLFLETGECRHGQSPR